MNTESNNHKPSNDKLHPSDLGETKDFNDLSFDKDKQSYELDVKGDDKDYDHPMPYETVAAGSIDDDSTYDEANPYVGDEYATNAEKAKRRPPLITFATLLTFKTASEYSSSCGTDAFANKLLLFFSSAIISSYVPKFL